MCMDFYAPRRRQDFLCCSLTGLDRHVDKVFQVGLTRTQSPYLLVVPHFRPSRNIGYIHNPQILICATFICENPKVAFHSFFLNFLYIFHVGPFKSKEEITGRGGRNVNQGQFEERSVTICKKIFD